MHLAFSVRCFVCKAQPYHRVLFSVQSPCKTSQGTQLPPYICLFSSAKSLQCLWLEASMKDVPVDSCMCLPEYTCLHGMLNTLGTLYTVLFRVDAPCKIILNLSDGLHSHPQHIHISILGHFDHCIVLIIFIILAFQVVIL